MDLFGIGPLNLLLILGVLLIVFGPERLPEMAAKAGKLVRDLRAYASDVTGEFSGELAEIQQHFTGVQDEFRGVGRDLQQTSSTFRDRMREAGAAVMADTTATPTMNEPPPTPAGDEKVVPLTNSPIRTRVEDYKPGS